MVKAYPYTDATGNLLFEVCRFEPKDFRQRRPNGSGGWIWKMAGVQAVSARNSQSALIDVAARMTRPPRCRVSFEAGGFCPPRP